MLTSPWLIRLRRCTRRLGINKLIGRVLRHTGYEARFGPAVSAEVRPGDTVWDIGANVGLYTQEFLACVGPSGQVVAFEPVPACFMQLQARFADHPQVRLKNVAIGETDGRGVMSLNVDPLAATHRVVGQPSADGETLQVQICSSRSIVDDEPEIFPNVVKIDVEGHEGAVLDGMSNILADRRLHCIGMEVHFALLDERGEGSRPRQMEQTLEQHGFRVRWTDSSHILAVR